jgi:cyclopropane-fatty-acyl-phospholipid synthase
VGDSRERDRRAVAHHYDVSNEFFRLLLDESMTYPCAIFSRLGPQTSEPRIRAR